jgi:hypothetical protein
MINHEAALIDAMKEDLFRSSDTGIVRQEFVDLIEQPNHFNALTGAGTFLLLRRRSMYQYLRQAQRRCLLSP